MKLRRQDAIAAGAAALIVLAGLAGDRAGAQQNAPAQQQQKAGKRAPTAPPPINWPSPPLPDGPVVFDTGIQHQIRLVTPKASISPGAWRSCPTATS
jgi:hypothetical protein